MADHPSGPEQQAHNDLVLSFLELRRAIGVLGYFLPAALIGYSLIFGNGILPTISDYYYSPMREVFVGTLCALAVFLWSYEGYRPTTDQIVTDKNTARAASLGALGVAWLPAAPAQALPDCTISQCVLGDAVVGMMHVAAAALFFGALAVFCLVLFVKGSDRAAEKRGSNRIYRLCGWIILAALAGIVVVSFTPLGDALSKYSTVFWLETVATLAFATSWAVKGDSLRPLVRMVAPDDPAQP